MSANQASSGAGGGRLRACAQAVAAILYFFLARSLARHGAEGLAVKEWEPLINQVMLVFLLLLGYAGMGFWFNRQIHPLREQGFPPRQGWRSEVGLGLAAGWALAVLCVLPMTVVGGIAITLSSHSSAWAWLLADAAFFALAALAEEVIFRGYGFQRLIQAVGPLGASLGFAAFYAFVQEQLPGSSRASLLVSIALGLVLSVAYLRTQALWLNWGLNFAWKASRALLFGVAISGVNDHSPVVQGDPMGPFWLTGGGFGLDGSWVTFFVLLAALPVIYRLTRELDYRYNAPVLLPAGIPVDLNAAQQRQHQAATGQAASTTSQPAQIVQIAQILPSTAPPTKPIERYHSE